MLAIKTKHGSIGPTTNFKFQEKAYPCLLKLITTYGYWVYLIVTAHAMSCDVRPPSQGTKSQTGASIKTLHRSKSAAPGGIKS